MRAHLPTRLTSRPESKYPSKGPATPGAYHSAGATNLPDVSSSWGKRHNVSRGCQPVNDSTACFRRPDITQAQTADTSYTRHWVPTVMRSAKTVQRQALCPTPSHLC